MKAALINLRTITKFSYIPFNILFCEKIIITFNCTGTGIQCTGWHLAHAKQ